MKSTIWLEHAPYRLTAYGNGASLELRRGARSVFLQGEDAATFIDEMENLEETRPDASPLPILWDWYEHVATGDAQ